MLHKPISNFTPNNKDMEKNNGFFLESDMKKIDVHGPTQNLTNDWKEKICMLNLNSDFMMRILALLISLILPFIVMAADKDNERGIVVGAGFGYTKYMSVYTGKNLIISPRLGYRINGRSEAGVKYSLVKDLDDRNYNTHSFGGYFEYDLARYRSFSLFVDANATFYKKGRSLLGFKRNFKEFGVTPGISYSFAKIPLKINVRYLFIGFNDSPDLYITHWGETENPPRSNWFKDAPSCLDSGNWIIDAGLRRLEIGVSFTFRL